MTVQKEFVDELKARIALPEIAGRHLRLIRRGRDTIALCPFHNEKTPSFHVYADHFHCFGCGAHGSVVDFVMRVEQLSFREAVERLAAAAGMTMPRETAEDAARDHRRRSLLATVNTAADVFHKLLLLPEGRDALEYLSGRGVSRRTIDDWRLGFAPDARDRLKSELLRDGCDESALVDTGLLVAPEGGGRSYDRFRGRVMFPINDRLGRTIGFGGRLIAAGEPKYLNSPEGPLFHKGQLLYGLDRASKAVGSGGELIVVEGYMDVIGLQQAGFPAAVAPLGTALTEQQLGELWRLSDMPVLCFDGDKAGERAARRAAERALPLLSAGRSVAVARLPEGHDPDSLVAAAGAEGFRRVLAAALPLSRFFVAAVTGERRLPTPEARLAAWQQLKALSESIADPLVRREYRQAFYEAVFPPEDRHRQRIERAPLPAGRASRSGSPAARRFAPAPRPVDVVPPDLVRTAGMRQRLHTTARILLAIIVKHPGIFAAVEEDLGVLGFDDRDLDGLRQALLEELSAEPELTTDGLVGRLNERGGGAILSSLLRDPLITRHRILAAADTGDEILRFWRAEIQAFRRAALAEELARTSGMTDDAWRRRQTLALALLADDGDC